MHAMAIDRLWGAPASCQMIHDKRIYLQAGSAPTSRSRSLTRWLPQRLHLSGTEQEGQGLAVQTGQGRAGQAGRARARQGRPSSRARAGQAARATRDPPGACLGCCWWRC
jgi:hypothetical protein